MLPDRPTRACIHNSGSANLPLGLMSASKVMLRWGSLAVGLHRLL
jgi:hypothetical protein